MSDGLQVTLIECGGPHSGREHVLEFGEHVIGRDPSVSVTIDHGDISRRHVRLSVGPEDVAVTDLGSKNGVWVLGRRVVGSVVLGHGDRFEVGGVEFEIRHPFARLGRALAASGEPTVTRTRDLPSDAAQHPGLFWPLMFGAAFLGAAIVAGAFAL